MYCFFSKAIHKCLFPQSFDVPGSVVQVPLKVSPCCISCGSLQLFDQMKWTVGNVINSSTCGVPFKWVCLLRQGPAGVLAYALKHFSFWKGALTCQLFYFAKIYTHCTGLIIHDWPIPSHWYNTSPLIIWRAFKLWKKRQKTCNFYYAV